MDALKFLSNRNLDMNTLFTASGPTASQVNYNGAMSALGNTLERQVRTWWDICTLEQYVKDKITIRSLRWEITPQDGLDDPSSIREWFDFFNGVAFKLQDLILLRKKRKMNMLENKINELQAQLDPIKDTQPIIDFNIRTNKRLEKVDKETQKKKIKKYHRDMNDYNTNNLYAWQSTLPEKLNLIIKPSGDETVTNESDTPYPHPERRLENMSEEEIVIDSPAQFSTPIRRGKGKSRGVRGRGSNHNQQPVPYPTPTYNYYQPLNTQQYNNDAPPPPPRPFLGRGGGAQRRGRGYPHPRGRPQHHPSQQYKEQDWRPQQPQNYWTRDQPQHPQPRNPAPEDVEQDGGSRKRSRHQ